MSQNKKITYAAVGVLAFLFLVGGLWLVYTGNTEAGAGVAFAAVAAVEGARRTRNNTREAVAQTEGEVDQAEAELKNILDDYEARKDENVEEVAAATPEEKVSIGMQLMDAETLRKMSEDT